MTNIEHGPTGPQKEQVENKFGVLNERGEPVEIMHLPDNIGDEFYVEVISDSEQKILPYKKLIKGIVDHEQGIINWSDGSQTEYNGEEDVVFAEGDMNQKGFINIAVIIGVIIIVGVAAYFIVRKVPPITPVLSPSPTLTPTTPTPTQDTINQGQNQNQKELTGVATESRKRFVDAGLSKQYFDTHFNLKDMNSGEDAGGRYTYVYWVYSVSEYKVEVTDRINHDRPESGLNTTLHNIQTVIPRQQALETLNSCLKSRLTNKEVDVKYDYQSGFKGSEGGKLFLSGSIQSGEQSFVVITQTKVNLENGQCDPVSQNKIYR